MSRENDVIRDKEHYDRIYGGDNRRETEQICERETIDLETRMQQKQDAKAKEKAARELAFKKAKMRYNSLNPLVKAFSKNPDKIDYRTMSADRINSLYGGKKR